jgi:surface antigen
MTQHKHSTLYSTLAALLVLLLATPALATPPPWAPAHGYRHKHRDYHDYPPILPWHGHGYRNEFLLGGRCDRAALGGVLGGIVGGMAGSHIGKGSGRTAATIAGTVIGILVGQSIGRHMDSLDQQCTGQALEHAPDHASVKWHNPDSDSYYRVTPLKTWRSQDGRYCREYTTVATIGGRSQQLYGQACRQPDGSWLRR